MEQVATLWIGDRLSFLEQLCLKSFVDLGQRITLYSYAPVAGVPAGVIQRDAAEIMPAARILRVARGRRTLRGSPALHADLFRLHLMAKTEAIWADADAYALRPLAARGGYLFAMRGGVAMNGVLRLPQDSPALARLVAFANGMTRLPDWVTGDERIAFESGAVALTHENLRWGAAGPDALHHVLTETGEIRHASGPNVLYPIPARDKLRFLEPGMAPMPPRAMSIHFWGTNLRAELARRGGHPPQGSMLELMCRMHGIVPTPETLPVAA